MVMMQWGQFAGYTLKLWEIWGHPTTGCLMFSTQASCLLIARGSYPPQHVPGLLESSLSQTAVLPCNMDQGYHHFGTFVQFNFGNALTKDQSSNWTWGVSICPSAVTLTRPHRPQKAATGWGMYLSSVTFILFSFFLSLIEELKIFRFKAKEKKAP